MASTLQIIGIVLILVGIITLILTLVFLLLKAVGWCSVDYRRRSNALFSPTFQTS